MKEVLLTVLKVFLGLIVLVCLILAFSYRADIPLDKLIGKYSDSNSYFLKINGINMHVRVKGRGEAIFLVHGSFSSLHTWEAWENELSQYFTTVSMDLPGHGLTGPDVEKRYSVAEYAEFVLEIADQLGYKEFHIAGNSMGGSVALQLGSEHPDRVLSINLINSSGAPRPKRGDDTTSSSVPIIRYASNPLFNKILLKCTPKYLFKMNLNQVYFDDEKITDDMVDRYYHLLRREGNRQATLDRLTGSKRSAEVNFSKLKMPVLIMWGAEDTWIPVTNGKLLADAIPRSKFKVFENVGHVPMEELPTETVIEYLAFLGIQVDLDYFSTPKHFSYDARTDFNCCTYTSNTDINLSYIVDFQRLGDE